jgi:hypothetical protein
MSQRRAKQPPLAPSMRGTSNLQELLRELAFALLPRGMTPKTFGELSRSAFVQAAADRSRLRNGRINHSRVAAQTGLTRADVKRLLNRDMSAESLASPETPVEKVINGWRCDPQFSNGRGTPRPLTITGKRPSFSALARKYAGDVPHRAVLDELRRMKAVLTSLEHVQLRAQAQLRIRHSFGFLSPVMPVLIDGLRIASEKLRTDPSTSIQRLLIPINTDVDLAFVRERCRSTAKAMLDGLAYSLDVQGKLKKRKRGASYFYAVTILLTESRTKKVPRLPPNSGAKGRK